MPTIKARIDTIEKRLNSGADGVQWSLVAARAEADSLKMRMLMMGKLKCTLKPMSEQDIEARARQLATKYKSREEYDTRPIYYSGIALV